MQKFLFGCVVQSKGTFWVLGTKVYFEISYISVIFEVLLDHAIVEWVQPWQKQNMPTLSTKDKGTSDTAATTICATVQTRMDHYRPKYLRSQQTQTSTRLLKAHPLLMHRFHCKTCITSVLLGLLLRSLKIFTKVQTFRCTGRLLSACTKSFLDPQFLDFCESIP